MDYRKEKLSGIYNKLQTDPINGLTEDKALEFQKRLGLNKFDEEKRETVFQKIIHHARDFTSLILLSAGAIALYLAMTSDHSYTDAIVIFIIIILNVTLAIRQEMGAEKALEALEKMNAQMTVVIRNGKKHQIDSAQLVPGDILDLKTGDMIPADARIIECIDLLVEESALTGESVPIEKDALAEIDETAPLGDQTNMLFSGCLITGGKVRAVVVHTGMQTEMGKIASLLNKTKKERTPLQSKMNNLGKVICIVALISAASLFLLQFFNISLLHEADGSIPLPIILLNAVSMAVAVIPECLPVIVTITLAFGVHNMAKRHAIIRKIPAVETLGSASVICSDKTGTLTMNRMTIKRLWDEKDDVCNDESEFTANQTELLNRLALASNAVAEEHEGELEIIGSPTESAIIRLLIQKKGSKKELEKKYPRVAEIPFSSERKMLTTIHKDISGGYLVLSSGAFDRIPYEAVSDDIINKRNEIHDTFAQDALRVLALGSRHVDELPDKDHLFELESNLKFEGIVGIIDPPRPESREAVQTAKEAGIKTVMITGDHKITASAIAREIGILSEGEKVITGVELAQMSQEDLIENVRDYSVYARVSPDDKIRIVQAWQAHDEVVAMTGDGVNDAPALKAADVGVAMGSGTDVSKNASDVILTDDNFASIVCAVAEGRTVYDNIRKVLYSLIACNISEIFTMLLAILIWGKAPLVAIQLLLINVIADGIPDLCICKEPMEEDAMRRKPVKKNASIFADGLIGRIVVVAVVFAVSSLLGYYIGRFVQISSSILPSHEVGMTMAYVAVGWTSVINILNVRSFNKSIFKIGLMSNKLLFYGVCFSIALVFVTAIIPPNITDYGYTMNIFHCVPISLNHWLILIGLALTPIIVVETQKFFKNKIKI